MMNSSSIYPPSPTPDEHPTPRGWPLLVLSRSLELILLEARPSAVQLGFIPDVRGLKGRELRRHLRDLSSIRQHNAYWTYLYQRLILVVPCRVGEELVIPNALRLRVTAVAAGGASTVELVMGSGDGEVLTRVIEPMPLPSAWVQTVKPGTFKARRETEQSPGFVLLQNASDGSNLSACDN